MEEYNAMTNTMSYLNSFPPGYRFSPTDEELINHYLKNKVLNIPLPPNKIRNVNLYSHSPQDLSAMYGEEEDRIMYFFTPRNRKYPNGNRPRRSAGNGFWKATGADTVIGTTKDPIGFRKPLVYYLGKPKDCTKTSWIMHEYRLNQNTPQWPAPDETALQNATTAPRDMKLDDWVLCKVYLNRNSDKKNQTATKIDSGSSSMPQPQFIVPNNNGSTGSATPMPTDVVSFSTSSSVPQCQFKVRNNIGHISSAAPMPDVCCSTSSLVPQRQFNMANNISILSYWPPTPAVVVGSSISSSVPQRQFNAPNDIGSTSSAPPMLADVDFSTSSSVPLHQFNEPYNISYISSPASMPDVVGCSTISLVPQRQFNAPNNIGSTSSAPPMLADVVGFSTSSSVPLHQFSEPYNIGYISSPTSMPDVVGCSTISLVPQRQFSVANNNSFLSSAPPTPADIVGFSTSASVLQSQLFNPVQTTNYSCNIQLDQPLHSTYFSSYPEDDGDFFFTMLGDRYPPFDDDITGPNNNG